MCNIIESLNQVSALRVVFYGFILLAVILFIALIIEIVMSNIKDIKKDKLMYLKKEKV